MAANGKRADRLMGVPFFTFSLVPFFIDGAIDVYLEIIRQVFIKSKQQAHYDMMMTAPQ